MSPAAPQSRTVRTGGAHGVTPAADAKPIYLDYQATTPIDPRVVEAMLPYLTTEFGNPSSSHTYGRAAARAVETWPVNRSPP